jgi:hypothetical protein
VKLNTNKKGKTQKTIYWETEFENIKELAYKLARKTHEFQKLLSKINLSNI